MSVIHARDYGIYLCDVRRVHDCLSRTFRSTFKLHM